MPLNVLNSFNSGDAITFLAGLRGIYEKEGIKSNFYQRLHFPAFYYEGATHPIADSDNKPVTMNEKQWNLLQPLIEKQTYIEKASVWSGEEIALSFDDTRDRRLLNMPYGNIHFWAFLVHSRLQTDLSKAWIEAETVSGYEDLVVINRTQRYQNPYISYFFLKPYENNFIFAGTETEHKIFCETWNIEVPLLQPKDFYELACIIKSCRFFMGNQSMCWHIADAMKSKRLLEFSPDFPNTFPTGANGQIFLYQQSLEQQFKELYDRN